MTVDERIMAYLRASIAERGGAGRRLSRIQVEMDDPPDAADFAAAVDRLVEAGRIRLEEVDTFGWVYAFPL